MDHINKKFEGVTIEYNKYLIESIKNVRDNFISTYVEKTDTNYAINCKKLYSNMLTVAYGSYELVNFSKKLL